jgi:hypothetical protein
MRLPILLGGSYYIYCLISAQASVLVAVHLYNLEMARMEDGKIAADTLWRMSTVLVGSWCIAMTFFLAKISTPTHRHTFWSLVSGRQCVQQYYTKGVTEENKLEIFTNNSLLWESDLGSEVMEFTLQNWAKWEREKPAWFTPTLKATVPDECIPREFLAGLGGANRMRRGSAAGSVRESFRMIQNGGSIEEVKVDDDNDADEVIENVEVVKGVEVINDAEDVEEEKEVVMEEGVVNIMR